MASELSAPLALDFSDSELAGAVWQGESGATRSLQLRLAAAALRPLQARLGAGDETRYLSGLVLELDGVDTHDLPGPPLSDWHGRLTAGVLQTPGQRRTRLPLSPEEPFIADGPLQLTLQLARGPVLMLQAQRLRLRWPGDAADPLPALAC